MREDFDGLGSAKRAESSRLPGTRGGRPPDIEISVDVQRVFGCASQTTISTIQTSRGRRVRAGENGRERYGAIQMRFRASPIAIQNFSNGDTAILETAVAAGNLDSRVSGAVCSRNAKHTRTYFFSGAERREP